MNSTYQAGTRHIGTSIRRRALKTVASAIRLYKGYDTVLARPSVFVKKISYWPTGRAPFRGRLEHGLMFESTYGERSCCQDFQGSWKLLWRLQSGPVLEPQGPKMNWHIRTTAMKNACQSFRMVSGRLWKICFGSPCSTLTNAS
jgi:hypothetical protein